MARELHSDEVRPEQRPPIAEDALADREGEIIIVDGHKLTKEYCDELAFMEEPVTLRLQPSSEKNSATTFPVWVNGKGAEVLINDRWIEFKYLPTGKTLTTKRKYVEPIIRAKIHRIETEIDDREGDRPINRAASFTSPVHSYTIIGDTERGNRWASELMRRYY